MHLTEEILSAEKFLRRKKLDEMLSIYLVKKNCMKILEAPIPGCIVLYFKDKKLNFCANIEEIYPKVTVKVLDETASLVCGFPITDIRDLNYLDSDFIILCEKPDFEISDIYVKEFFDIYDDERKRKSLEYWNDREFMENLELKKYHYNIEVQ